MCSCCDSRKHSARRCCRFFSRCSGSQRCKHKNKYPQRCERELISKSIVTLPRSSPAVEISPITRCVTSSRMTEKPRVTSKDLNVSLTLRFLNMFPFVTSVFTRKYRKRNHGWNNFSWNQGCGPTVSLVRKVPNWEKWPRSICVAATMNPDHELY